MGRNTFYILSCGFAFFFLLYAIEFTLSEVEGLSVMISALRYSKCNTLYELLRMKL
jgi:hypothetical protein